jgi:catechol 2,3-dioxygenase-like lactoylglutathione lyase family enzyme
MTSVQPSGDSWAKLRQVAMASDDAPAGERLLRETLGLPVGFADPELPKIGMTDATLALGDETYLEVIGVADETSHLNRWLAKVGGSGGYAISVQVPDVSAIRKRAGELGVRIAIDTTAFGRPVLQLHPKDVGMLLEFDEIDDPAVWFWDDVTPGPSADAVVDRIEEIEVGVEDPQAMAELWATLAGLERKSPTSVDFGPTITFVPAVPAQLKAIVLAVRDGQPHPPTQTMLNVEFRFV